MNLSFGSKSELSVKSSNNLKKYIKSHEQTHKIANKHSKKSNKTKSGSKNSKISKLSKASKSSKTSYISKSTNKNNKSKNKVIIPLEQDVLVKFGYSNIKLLSLFERRKALKRAIQKLKPLSIYRRIIAISTLNKNKDRDLYLILKADAEWIKKQTEYINQKANSKKSSKSSKTQQGGYSEKNSSGYIPNNLRYYSSPLEKNFQIKNNKEKSNSKEKNKLFYYKDN